MRFMNPRRDNIPDDITTLAVRGVILNAGADQVDIWLRNPYRLQKDNPQRVGVFEVQGGWAIAHFDTRDGSLRVDLHESRAMANTIALSFAAMAGRAYLETKAGLTPGFNSWVLRLTHSLVTEEWRTWTGEASAADWKKAHDAAAELFHQIPPIAAILAGLASAELDLSDNEPLINEWLATGLSADAITICLRNNLAREPAKANEQWNKDPDTLRFLAALL